MSADESRTLNPAAMPLADAARMFTRVGGEPVGAEMLEADVAEGAPTNVDGTLNLVEYAAWILKEMGRGD